MIKVNNTKKWREINKDYYKEYMRKYMYNYRERNKIKLKKGCPKGKRKLDNSKPKFQIIKKIIIIEF